MRLPNLSHYIAGSFDAVPILKKYERPWAITASLLTIIKAMLPTLSPDAYHISGNIAIHKKAVLEERITLKEYSIIEEGAMVKAGSYLRDGVYLGKRVSIGPNCEIKQSMIFEGSRIAHLNYVGNSLIGADVNLEAGSILANHFNERINKEIEVLMEGKRMMTSVTKFGSLLGDGCRIGANAVLNPGTILPKSFVVGRLEHVDQLKQ